MGEESPSEGCVRPWSRVLMTLTRLRHNGPHPPRHNAYPDVLIIPETHEVVRNESTCKSAGGFASYPGMSSLSVTFKHTDADTFVARRPKGQGLRREPRYQHDQTSHLGS